MRLLARVPPPQRAFPDRFSTESARKTPQRGKNPELAPGFSRAAGMQRTGTDIAEERAELARTGLAHI